MSQDVNIKELNERIKKESEFVDLITLEIQKVIVGQKGVSTKQSRAVKVSPAVQAPLAAMGLG